MTLSSLMQSRLGGLNGPGPGGQGTGDRLADLSGFGTNPGRLRARTYIPPNLPTQAPLVVVLHGCTQTAAGYDHGSGWSALADRCGFALLYPEQQRANNPNGCFNWFRPEHNRREAGEPLSIRQMVASVVEAHDLDAQRIFVTGLSAGGAMASVMLATYPDVFAGGAVIAGLSYGRASTIPQAFQQMQGQGSLDDQALGRLVTQASVHRGPWPVVSVWHGTADHTVNVVNAAEIVSQWRAVHATTREPSRTDVVDGYPHRIWTDADGREVIEEYSITGMGHGTPLSTVGSDGFGASGAFMIEVNISSTVRIARFWGLLDTFVSRQEERDADPVGTGTSEVAARTAQDADAFRGPVTAASTHVQTVIENALRAAGLMR